MFTGIIEAVGKLVKSSGGADGRRLRIAAPDGVGPFAEGESVAVDGVCLTVESGSDDGFECQASPETLARTALGHRQPGDAINLERALVAGGRLGGHFVTGHVDATGRIRSLARRGNSWDLLVEAPDDVLSLCVMKGSIAVDGISLTVASLDDRGFGCAIVPHTLTHTTLSLRRPGDAVNLEADLIAKHVSRLLQGHGGRAGGIGLEALRNAGFLA